MVGVADDDVLNMRIGPGTDCIVIDQLPSNARGLRQITCVPLLIPPIHRKLTEAQRTDLTRRWCMMRTVDLSRAGWVRARFLMEDGLQQTGITDGPFGSEVIQMTGDPTVDEAVLLVRNLYAAFDAMDAVSDNHFAIERARQYFAADLVPALAGRGADLLYGAQDFGGRITRIGPDPDRPMFLGMITVTVDLTNFGHAWQIAFRLRSDPESSARRCGSSV